MEKVEEKHILFHTHYHIIRSIEMMSWTKKKKKKKICQKTEEEASVRKENYFSMRWGGSDTHHKVHPFRKCRIGHDNGVETWEEKLLPQGEKLIFTVNTLCFIHCKVSGEYWHLHWRRSKRKWRVIEWVGKGRTWENG